MTRARAAQEPAEGLSTSEQGIGPYEPTAAVQSLPSANIQHASVLANELTNRMHQFDSGIIALQGELEGQQEQHERAMKDVEDRHLLSKADLLRRIGDLQKGKKMLSAALDAAEENATG